MHAMNSAVEVCVGGKCWQVGRVVGTEKFGNDLYYTVRVNGQVVRRAWWDVRSL